MISKGTSKFLNSLQVKKYRQLHQSFLVQGAKSVKETLQSDFEIKSLYCTAEFLEANKSLVNSSLEVTVCEEKELAKVGTLKSNNAALAIVAMKSPSFTALKTDKFYLVLDRVGDPGNLGTIIRLADWYGVDTIVCSEDCADVYNPKVISSTMGAFSRVEVVYRNLQETLSAFNGKVYGAYLEGKNVHQENFAFKGVLVMGSESQGISEEVSRFITEKITIPSFGNSESLNVAVATGILLDNFRRSSSTL